MGVSPSLNRGQASSPPMDGDHLVAAIFSMSPLERRKFLHIHNSWPRFFYKFRAFSSEDRLRSQIVRNEIFLSSPRDFNDPFDMRGMLVIKGGIDALFATSTDSLIKHRVTKDILASDTTMTMDCLEAMDKYPFATKLPLLKRPVYLIESAFIPTDTAAFTKLGVAYVFYDMGNVGHYPMLENSSRFNALLENIVHACGKQ